MVSDHFYLTMQTVTLKRLTSWPCLSLSVSSYLLRDFFFQALSAGRTHSVQICTTTRRKRQGVGHSSTVCERRAALHIQLDWMQGIIPLSKLGFHSSTDVNLPQSQSNESISLPKDKREFGQMRNGGSLGVAWKGNSVASAPSSRKHWEGCSCCGHTKRGMSSSCQNLIETSGWGCVLWYLMERMGKDKKGEQRMCTEAAWKAAHFLTVGQFGWWPLS